MEGGAALNRVTWTQSGLHVAAGDDLGKIWVYDVGEQLAVPQPDEWNKFAHTLQVVNAADDRLGYGHDILNIITGLDVRGEYFSKNLYFCTDPKNGLARDSRDTLSLASITIITIFLHKLQRRQ